MAVTTWYDVRSDNFGGAYENPLKAIEVWRKWHNARLSVSLWSQGEGEEEATLIGEPIDITHLALHLIENEREREQGRAR